MRYFIAAGKVREKVMALIEQTVAANNHRVAFMKEFRASEVISWAGVSSSPWGLMWKGDTTAKHAGFRYNKRRECWFPDRSTKTGKAIEKRMAEEKYKIATGADYADAVGMKYFTFDDHGMRTQTPGLRVLGDDVLLTVADNCTPRGCKRISDIEAEQMVAAHKASKKRKAAKA